MGIDDQVKRLQERIDKYHVLKDCIQALEQLEEAFNPSYLGNNWQLTMYDKHDADAVFGVSLPAMLFNELVGTGLRVLLPVMKQRLEEFDLLQQ